MLKPHDATLYRKIPKILLDNKIEFTCAKLPEDRTVKVVIKGISIDVSNEELKSELESLNFHPNSSNVSVHLTNLCQSASSF